MAETLQDPALLQKKRAEPRVNILLVDDQPANLHIAAELHCDRHTVGLWRERFVSAGLAGLQDAPRSGRPRKFSPRRTHRRPHPGHQQDRRA